MQPSHIGDVDFLFFFFLFVKTLPSFLCHEQAPCNRGLSLVNTPPPPNLSYEGIKYPIRARALLSHNSTIRNGSSLFHNASPLYQKTRLSLPFFSIFGPPILVNILSLHDREEIHPPPLLLGPLHPSLDML